MRLVRFVGVVALGACGMPLFRAPPPAPQAMPAPPRFAAAFSSIAWYQGGCLGSCPVYQIALTSGGLAQYDGRCFTPLVGRYQALIDSTTFARAATLILGSDFFRSDTLLGLAVDMPSITITVVLTDGRRRTVTYGLVYARYEPQLEGLVARLPWRYIGPAEHECALPN